MQNVKIQRDYNAYILTFEFYIPLSRTYSNNGGMRKSARGVGGEFSEKRGEANLFE